jgi:Tol biopolymer transport system component
VLERCLAKDVKQRLRDIGDVRSDLEHSLTAGRDTSPTGASTRRRWRWAVASAGVLVVAGGVLFWRRAETVSGPVVPVTRTTVTLPPDQALDILNSAQPLALSPDGRRLVYGARREGVTQLYVRDLAAFEANPIAGTEGARYPFFSPNGESVAFFADGKLKRVPTSGGSPVSICDAQVGRGGTWSPDGTIVFDAAGLPGLLRVSASGGRPEPLTSRDPDMDARTLMWPQFLPDGRGLLATVGQGADAALAVLALDTGTWHPLGRGFQAHYLPSGHLVFHAPDVREGELRAVAFDVEQLAIRGEPATVLDGLFRSENGGGAYFAVAPTGDLVFAPGGHARALVRVDRTGRRTPLVDERRGFRQPRISPDGRQVAVTVDPRPSQIWVYEIDRRTGYPLATDSHSLSPLWTPDGRRVAYFSRRAIYARAADGRTAAERLLARADNPYPHDWSRDAQLLFFNEDHPTNKSDVWLLTGTGDTRPLVATPAHESAPRLSPDGRWLAYQSDESGRPEIYVRPFPNVHERKWMVSTSGGLTPVWSQSGRDVFYMRGTTMMAVPVDGRGGAFTAGVPVPLFDGPFETGSPDFDDSPDGTYFVMVEADPNARPTQIHVVLNWTEDLKRTAPSSQQ